MSRAENERPLRTFGAERRCNDPLWRKVRREVNRGEASHCLRPTPAMNRERARSPAGGQLGSQDTSVHYGHCSCRTTTLVSGSNPVAAAQREPPEDCKGSFQESVWWRCHRRMIADFLELARGVPIRHVMHSGNRAEHVHSEGVRVRDDGLLVYGSVPVGVARAARIRLPVPLVRPGRYRFAASALAVRVFALRKTVSECGRSRFWNRSRSFSEIAGSIAVICLVRPHFITQGNGSVVALCRGSQRSSAGDFAGIP